MKQNHKSIENSSESVSRDEYEKLKTELDHLRNKVETQPQTINNTTTYNNNQIFIINSFGSENIDYINDEFVKNSLKQPKRAINSIIRQIHFNPGRPENHNVKITNKKMPYISVFKNNSWEYDDKKKGYRSDDIQKLLLNGKRL